MRHIIVATLLGFLLSTTSLHAAQPILSDADKVSASTQGGKRATSVYVNKSSNASVSINTPNMSVKYAGELDSKENSEIEESPTSSTEHVESSSPEESGKGFCIWPFC